MRVDAPAGNPAPPNPAADQMRHAPTPWHRPLLLALLLLAFAHAVILLDAKDLWWDEIGREHV